MNSSCCFYIQICFLDYTPLGNLDQQLILSDHKVFNFGKQLGTSNHATLHPNHFL